MTKKRSVVVAGIASLLAPTVGHVYVGRPFRGIVILGAALLAPLVLGHAGAARSVGLFYAMQALYLGLFAFLIVDCCLIARRAVDYRLKPHNRGLVYILVAAGIYVGLGALAEFRGSLYGFDSHRIPASSMTPTLSPGDYVATDTRMAGAGYVPERGTVVVFEFPRDRSLLYVKRVAGLPGETIAIVDGVLFIDGAPLPAGLTTQVSTPDARSQNFPPTAVPEGAVFVLGDDRGNSYDSRFWGPVPLSHIRGEVTLIWYSPVPGRTGSEVR
ncbi:MAG: signal peptidase I [Pseudomonadota bacterium]